MYIDRLEKLAPHWFPTISLRADLLCATNQPLQAFELLKSFVDMTDAVPADRAPASAWWPKNSIASAGN